MGFHFFPFFLFPLLLLYWVLFYSIYLDLECVLHDSCSNISSPIRHTGLLTGLKEREFNGDTTREF